MDTSSAQLKNYRQAPRKVRLIADLVRGKSVERALMQLQVLPKRASGPMEKLIRSAAANAKDIPMGDLYISKIEVGGGVIFKRFMPRARGKAAPIKKKTSHITISLARKAPKKAVSRPGETN
ncbi:MAG: 50S ribosomal protein L22 [Patescibacteria group bacterium]